MPEILRGLGKFAVCFDGELRIRANCTGMALLHGKELDFVFSSGLVPWKGEGC